MVSKKTTPAYRDPNLSTEKRVDDLLSRMTPEEKIAQMNEVDMFGVLEKGRFSPEKAKRYFEEQGAGAVYGMFVAPTLNPDQNAMIANELQKFAAENSRLGIPILIGQVSPHGLMALGATIFPTAIGMASTWDPALVQEAASLIAKETRAIGGHITYSAVLGLARDPRWGRTEETLGEDPYLASRMAVALVKGWQGRSLNTDHSILADVKHFAAYSASEGGHNWGPADIPERTLREVYLVPFEAAIREGGAQVVMPAYNVIDGVPCHVNKELLTKILREEWGFQGYVVTDNKAIETLVYIHHVAEKPEEAVRMAVDAGVDMRGWDMDFGVLQEQMKEGSFQMTFPKDIMEAFQRIVEDGVKTRGWMRGWDFPGILLGLVREGQISEERINQSVRRILRLKFLLGLFENPYVDPERSAKVVGSEEHRELALQVARQSIILLKNEGNILPLKKNVRSIAVIGPNANEARNQLGGYSAEAKVVTVLEGIRNKVSSKTKVHYAKGCSIKGSSTKGFQEAVEAAKKSDAAIVVVGGASWTSESTCGEMADRADLNLPGVQEDLIKAIHESKTPMVVVLINGRPLTINWVADQVPAILEAWYPGEEGGNAVADVLFGNFNPSGRLPITFPRSVGQLPVYYNHKPSARFDYIDMSSSPLFVFGYGLSYTEFEYSNLKMNPKEMGPAGKINVSVDVQNVGSRRGDEVVQLYVSDVVGSIERPVKELKSFKRITLDPGEKATVTFTLMADQLAFYNRVMKRVVEPGAFEVMVGGSSAEGISDSFEVVEPT